MPIRPENRNRYPKNWKQIRESILERAGHKCEWCDLENYAMVPHRSLTDCRKPPRLIKIVLTIAHMDHTPENCAPENLRALCQRCHNRYDAPMRAAGRKARRTCPKS